jgi:hypothetical protein
LQRRCDLTEHHSKDDLAVVFDLVVFGLEDALRVDIAGRSARFQDQTADGKVRNDLRLR